MSSRRWGLIAELANSLVRFSLGRDSSLEEVEYAEKVLPEVIRRAQRYRKSRENFVNDLSIL